MYNYNRHNSYDSYYNNNKARQYQPINIQPANHFQNRQNDLNIRNNDNEFGIRRINSNKRNINNNFNQYDIRNNIRNVNYGNNNRINEYNIEESYLNKKNDAHKENMNVLYKPRPNSYKRESNIKNNEVTFDYKKRRELPNKNRNGNQNPQQNAKEMAQKIGYNNNDYIPKNYIKNHEYISYDKKSKNNYININNDHNLISNKDISDIKNIQQTNKYDSNYKPQYQQNKNLYKYSENDKNNKYQNYPSNLNDNDNNINNMNKNYNNNFFKNKEKINHNFNFEIGKDKNVKDININNFRNKIQKNEISSKNREDKNFNNLGALQHNYKPIKLYDIQQNLDNLNKNSRDDNNIKNFYNKDNKNANFVFEKKNEKNHLINKYGDLDLNNKNALEEKNNIKQNYHFENKNNDNNFNNQERANRNFNNNLEKDKISDKHKIFRQMTKEKNDSNLGFNSNKAEYQSNNERRYYSEDKNKKYIHINNNAQNNKEEKPNNYISKYYERQNKFMENINKKIGADKQGNNDVKINNYMSEKEELIMTKNALDNRNISSLNTHNTIVNTSDFTRKMIEPILNPKSDNRVLSPQVRPSYNNNNFNNMNNNGNARNNMNNRNVNIQNINNNNQIINQRKNNQINQNKIITQNNFNSNNNNNNARKIPNNMRPVSPEQMNNIQIRKEFLNDNRNNNINSNNNRINSRSPFFYHNNFQNNNNNQNVINNNNGMNMNNMNNMNNMHNNGMNMNMNNMHNNRMIMNNNNNNNFKVMNMNNNNFNFNGMNMNNKFINPNNINMITNQNQFNQNNNMKFNQIVPFNNNLVNNNKVNIPIMNQNQNFVQNQFILMQNQMMMNQFQNMNMGLGNNQFIQRSKSSSHFGRPVPRPPNVTKNCACGLQNIGATCYMNATLQCLAHVNVLVSFMLKEKDIIRKYSYKNKLANSFLEVLENLWQNNNLKDFAPHKFKQLISNMNPLFAGVQANDSKDLVLFLLETMHDELNKVKNKKQNNETVDQYSFENSFKSFTLYFQQNFQSVISDNFYGMYDSIMKCLNCNIVTHNIQCYNILIIPLEEVRKFKNRPQKLVTIRECFEYYQKPEYMTGQNQIYCNRCKQMANSVNSSFLIVGPKLLVINLNRGKGLQFNIKLDFDEYINISDFIYFKSTPTKYKLIGVVTHFGPSGMSGHFIAFCNSFMDNKWYRYNDSLVTPSSFQDAKNTGVPYILFYQAQ